MASYNNFYGKIDEFIFWPEECHSLKLILSNIWWLSGGSKCTERYGILICLLHGCTNCALCVTLGGTGISGNLFMSY